MKGINFLPSVIQSYESILSSSSPNNWAIYGYDKASNDLKVLETGDGGLDELFQEFDDSKILYSFCKVIEPISELPKYVLISFCGEGVPISRKARSTLDVDPKIVMKRVQDSSGAKYSIHRQSVHPSLAKAAPSLADRKPTSQENISVPPVSNLPAKVPRANFAPISTAPKYVPPTSSSPASASPNKFSSPRYSSAATPVKTSSFAFDSKIASHLSTSSETRDDSNSLYQGTTSSYVPVKTNPKPLKINSIFMQQEAENTRTSVSIREERERNEKLEREREINARKQQENLVSKVDETKNKVLQSKVPPEVQKLPEKKESTTAIALYEYEAAEENEISLLENEEITDIVRLDEGWWQGTNSRGQTGLFPANYVELQVPTLYSSMENIEKIERERKELERQQEFERQKRAEEERERQEKEALKRREQQDQEKRELARRQKEEQDRKERERTERIERERLEREQRERLQREAEIQKQQEQERLQREAEIQRQQELLSQVKINASGSLHFTKGLTAIALYDYEASEENEINLKEGEIVQDIVQVDEGWWQGTNQSGRVGLFPANYVELQNKQEEQVPQPNQGRKAIALYDYSAAEANELSFAAGQTINEIVVVSDDWWQGSINGMVGLFPATYVELEN